jgi:hypothetical protein
VGGETYLNQVCYLITAIVALSSGSVFKILVSISLPSLETNFGIW